MYCKYCGKEIADDSKFCQHCGGYQSIGNSSKNDNPSLGSDDIIATTKGNASLISFFSKYKICILLYIVWLIINTLLLLQGEAEIFEYSQGGYRFKSNDFFYPFTSSGYQTSFMFNVKYYDLTEFIVYCFLLPLIIYVLFLIWRNFAGERIKSILKKIFNEHKESAEMTFDIAPINDITENTEKKETFLEISIEKQSHNKYDSSISNGYSEGDNEDNGVFDFIVSASKIAGIILIMFLVLTLFLMYIPNFYLGCILSITSGLLTFCLIRINNSNKDNISKDSKEERSPLYYTGLIVFTFFLLLSFYKMGKTMIIKSLNQETQPATVEEAISVNERLKEVVKNSKYKLPLIIDEKLTWSDIKLVKNGILCVYIIDDASMSIYELDLAKYKEKIALYLIKYVDRQLLELCMQSEKSLNIRLVSLWEENKKVNITFGNLEIGELLEEM